MIADKMKPLVENNSAIRMMFEEGRRLSLEYGADKVYDFSLGNPNVPSPPEVNQAIAAILEEEPSTTLHGYMNNAGFEDVREAVAESLNKRFQTKFHKNNIIMTVGAAGGLNVILKTLLNPGDEVITFAPYFLEYGAYVRNYDGILKEAATNPKSFQPDLSALEAAITDRTRAIITNSPHNPTGVVYSEDVIRQIAGLLEQKSQEYGHPLVWISDEPYRELAYDGVEVPYITKYYANTVVGYSYSKSLSLPGERIGYLVIPDEMTDHETVFAAAAIANRVLGFVNAPSLMQKTLAKCLDVKLDLAAYDRNRRLLYDSLTAMGFECVKPEGAFYLFLKAPVADEREFCEAAKKLRILMVPGRSFSCPGYVRIAYCVSYETIERSLPAFQALADQYQMEV